MNPLTLHLTAATSTSVAAHLLHAKNDPQMSLMRDGRRRLASKRCPRSWRAQAETLYKR